MRKTKAILDWVLCVLASSFVIDVAAQSGASCANALPLQHDSCLHNVAAFANEVWYKFTAVSPNENITYTITEPGYADFQVLSIYNDSCTASDLLATSNLSSINPHIISLNLNGLSIGRTYTIKLDQPSMANSQTNGSKFNLCLQSTQSVVAYWGGCLADANGNVYYCCTDVDPISGFDFLATECGLVDTVCVGDSIYALHASTNINYVMDSSVFAVWQFQGGSCAGMYIDTTFQSYACSYNSPGIYNISLGYFWDDPNGPTILLAGVKFKVFVRPAPTALLSLNQASFCIGDTVMLTSIGSGTEGLTFYIDSTYIQNCITQPTTICDSTVHFPDLNSGSGPLLPGSHLATLIVGNECGQDTMTIPFEVKNPDPCFTYISNCYVQFYPDTSICQVGIVTHLWDFGDGFFATGPNPTHVFSLDNVSYNVTHYVVTIFGDTLQCTLSVIQIGGPDATIAGLQVNNCGSGVVSYTSMCQPGVIYTWSVNGGTGNQVSGCQYDVVWNNSGGFIVLIAFDPIGDCTSQDTLFVPACCYDPSALTIDNRTASSVLNDQAFAPFISGSVFSTSQVVIINGVFIIDVPFTFQNCPNINFGANAQIQVSAGQNFVLDNSRIQTFCGFMWDGIYINGNTANCSIINGSNIQQAKNAVVSLNGGVFTISNSTLRNNCKDVVVSSYAAVHAGTIIGTTFTMNAPFLPSIPALPLGYTKTVCAIEIENNSQITIGDASQPALRNRFNNVLVGIRSKNSRTTVVNAEFTNFNPSNVQSFVPDAGTGIVSIGGKSTNNYLASLTVGGTGNAPCLFDNMKTAINISQRSNNYIYNNTIRKVSIYGIRVFNADAYGIDISGNTITNSGNVAFNTGIYLAECYNATVNINNNTINQTAVQPLQNGVGISVSLAAPSSMTMNIFNNTIARVRTGIWLYQLTGPSNVFVKGNNVRFFKPNQFYQSSVHYGLRLEGCITVSVDSNRVTKNGSNPNAQMLQQLRGISVENSPGSLVINNYFEKCGSGLFAIDFCFGTTIACDTFTSCYNGVLLATNINTGLDCFIGDQVYDPLGVPAQTGCEWNNTQGPQGSDVTGFSLNPIFWRYNGNPPSIGANNVILQLVNYSACQTFYQLPPPPIEREMRIEQSIVAGADSLIPVESKHWYNKYAYRQLNQNTSLITLNLPDDTLYQNFYANHRGSNTRLIRGIEFATQLGDTVMINDSCTSLQSSNLIEHNIKTVYRIYSNSYLPHGGNLTNGDSTVLMPIALADPAVEGPAVYTARAMLNLEQHYFSGNPQRTAQSDFTDNVIPPVTVDVYPNPADDAINIVLNTKESSSNVTVKLIDVSGREVLSQSHTESKGKISLDVSSVEAGTYLLSIFKNGVNVTCQPIVVTH